MFDLGWSELLIIAIIAILVVGPKDLPPLMKAVAQWLGKMRQMAAHFQSGVDEMIRQSELEDLRKDLRQIHSDLRTPVSNNFPSPSPSPHIMTDTGVRQTGEQPSPLPLPPSDPNLPPGPQPTATPPPPLATDVRNTPEPAAPAKAEEPTPAGTPS